MDESREGEEDIAAKGKGDPKKQRCSLPNLWTAFNLIREQVPEESWELVNKTCFAPFINAFKDNVLSEKEFIRQSLDFEMIMQFYKGEGKFDFDGTVLELRPHHVSKMFSLPNEGEKFAIDKGKETVPLCNQQQVFILKKPNTVGPSRAMIKERLLLELTKGNNMDHRLVASLLLMLVFTCVFFPKTGTNISWDLVIQALDLENVNKYNWSQSIWDYLISGLANHDKSRFSYIAGCTILVVYWFIDVLNYRKPSFQKDRITRPRFCRLDTTCLFDRKKIEKNPNLLVVCTSNSPIFSKLLL